MKEFIVVSILIVIMFVCGGMCCCSSSSNNQLFREKEIAIIKINQRECVILQYNKFTNAYFVLYADKLGKLHNIYLHNEHLEKKND